ncbi:MAG: tyrosine-type recombinase/integrase [Pseudomonadota bacterium]
MPIYADKRNGKKVQGRWRVRIWHKGKKTDWTVEGKKTDAEAFEARQRLLLEANAPQDEVRSAPTFFKFSKMQYMTHAALHLKASTLTGRKYSIATLIEFFGDTKLTEITAPAVERFIKVQLDRGLRPSSVNDLTKVLRAVLTYAKEINVPCAEPKIFKVPERGRAQVKFWTEEQVFKLYDKTRELSPELLPLVVALANTGMRRGEALALRWRDVDLDARVITIRPSEEWQPKTGKARQVPINDALLPYLTGQRQSEEYVFPCPATGDRWSYWPNRKFDKARKAAGLTGGPHTLRHTYASHMVLQTRDFFLVARLLGHSTSWVTERYAHLLPEHLDRARDALSFGTLRIVAEA